MEKMIVKSAYTFSAVFLFLGNLAVDSHGIELGAGAGYTYLGVNYEIRPQIFLNPLLLYVNKNISERISVQGEFGWGQIAEKGDSIREGYLEDGVLKMGQTVMQYNRAHYLTISVLVKNTAMISSFRCFGQLGPSVEFPVLMEQNIYGNKKTIRPGDDPGITQPPYMRLQIDCGADYSLDNVTVGVSIGMKLFIVQLGSRKNVNWEYSEFRSLSYDYISHDAYVQAPMFTLRLNIGYRGLFENKHAGKGG